VFTHQVGYFKMYLDQHANCCDLIYIFNQQQFMYPTKNTW